MTFSSFENDTLILWERGEGILMGANLIGSVVAGLVAVVLGTAQARGLSEPGDRAAAVTRVGEATATGLLDPAISDDRRAIPANSDRSNATGGLPVADGGSRR